MEGERKFRMNFKLPEDISEIFYKKYNEFLSENKDQIKFYFSELLEMKRPLFSIELAAPIKIIQDMENLLIEKRYHIYNKIKLFHEEDKNYENYPQEVFDKYPNEVIVNSIIYISLRSEFIHLAELVENTTFSCDIHDICDARATLKGLIHGYQIKNIIGFIEQ